MRSCRRNELEKQQHERAVKIRKMTDEQLCNYIDSLKQDRLTKKEERLIIENYISYIHNQPGNGIGRAIEAKLKDELDNYIVT